MNAMSGAGSRVAMMLIGFSLTPYIIHSLGIARFGLFAVVGALPAYLGLLDFGLSGAFVKFITEYIERDDRASARQVVTFGMIFYLAFGLVLAVPVLFAAPWIVHFFKMPASDVPEAIWLFRVLFGLLIFSWAFNVPGMAIVAMHRMDLASRNNFVGYLGYAVTTVVFLKAGFGIRGLVAALAVQYVLTVTLQFFTARRVFGPVFHTSLRFEREILGRLFSFGGWTQANSILNAINVDVGRFIAASVVSVASVGYYEIGSKLSYFSKSMPGYLLDAILPAAAAYDARGDEKGLRDLYRAGTLYNVFLTFALTGLVVGGADPLVRVWLGQSYPFVSDVIFWLAVAYAISSLAGVGTTILRASGKPKYETYFSAVSTVITICTTLPLAHRFGIVGAAMGSALGWIAGTAYFTVVFHKLHPSSWLRLIGLPALRLATACAVASGAFYFVVHAAPVVPLFTNRMLGLVLLGALGAAYLAVYVACTWMFGAWRADREFIFSKGRALRLRARALVKARLPRSA
ncbi:MAG: oligosaccharide flippase family protein [Vulcanimicrobiaceae bacterium]